jgi:LmbE family N-acetylglucosaminyl deacetylase
VKVLGVFAHGDDETLSAGASLAEHCVKNDKVFILILSAGASSRPGRDYDRTNDVAEALKILGVKDFTIKSYPDNRFELEHRLEICQLVEKQIQAFGPDLLYTHSNAEISRDHQVVREAVLLACRPHKMGGRSRLVLGGESFSATESAEFFNQQGFKPTVWQAVSGEAFSKKLQALSVYKGELQPFPNPRSLEALEALGKYRGAQSGNERCEAFEVLNWVRSVNE